MRNDSEFTYRGRLEEMTLAFANAVASVIAEVLEERTNHNWFARGDACFLNWRVEVRCGDCPRDVCIEFHDRLFEREGFRGLFSEKHIELAVETVLAICAEKKRGGACWLHETHEPALEQVV